MRQLSNAIRTRMVVPPTKLTRKWQLIDVKGQILGRAATKIANALQGRGKTNWSPMQDIGDQVVVINMGALRLSGQKRINKKFYHHSGYIGHLKALTVQQLQERQPTEILRKAVYGMLPRTRLRAKMIKRLHLFMDAKHPFDKKFKAQ